MTTLPFLDKLTITLKNVPKYPLFQARFIEPTDKYLLQLFMDSKDPKITKEMKTMLDSCILRNIKNNNQLSVFHNQRHGLGRFYPDKDISIIPHAKFIKHTLFKYLGWLDLDMVKGHPSIAIEIGKLNKFPLPAFEKYAYSFDEICKTLIEFYQDKDEEDEDKKLNDDDIKYCFCMMIYGGGFKTWVKNLAEGDLSKGYKPKKIKNEEIVHPLIQDYKDECKVIMRKVCSSNPTLVKKLKQNNEEKWETECRVISYWFQIIENHILYICYEFLIEREIIKPTICGLEYDGLCIPPPDKPFDKDALINDLNTIIKVKTGLSIKMKFKDYSNDNIMFDIIEERNKMVIAEPIESINATDVHEYPYFATEFEKTHFKIIEKGCYVKLRENDVMVMSTKLLNDAYCHMEYFDENTGKTENFIKKWTTNNPAIRRFTNMDIYPDNSKCPSDYFNLWIPFTFENKIVEGFTFNPDCEKTEFILNHIKILCDHQIEVYDYIVKYIAQMIQFPAVKSIVPTFISKQGAGKGTLLKLLSRMLGTEKVFETTDPSRDVWGNFNSMMMSSFLVNLNELSKKDTLEAEGKFKGLVTDSSLIINGKNQTPFKITSHHRFINTTNKEDPITTTQDDRRNIIIRSSDEKCGDKVYFQKMNEYLDDDMVVKNIYEYFKKIPDMDKFGMLSIPNTTYQNNLKDANRNILDIWLEAFTTKYMFEKGVIQENSQLFLDFNEWKEANNIDYTINNIKFGCKLANLKVSGMKRDDSKKKWQFDIPALKKHYKL